MKILRKTSIATGASLAFSLALPAGLFAQFDADEREQHPGIEQRGEQQPGEQRQYELRDGDQRHESMRQHGGHQAEELMGMEVQNRQGEKLGEIEDFVIDLEAEEVAYIIVSGGGILGLGATERAIPPQALQFSHEEDTLILDIDEQRWDDAPEFDRDQLEHLGQAERGREIYQFYGQNWQPGEARQRGVFGQRQPAGGQEQQLQQQVQQLERQIEQLQQQVEQQPGQQEQLQQQIQQLEQQKDQIEQRIQQQQDRPGQQQDRPGQQQSGVQQQDRPGQQQSGVQQQDRPGQQQSGIQQQDRPTVQEGYTSLALGSDLIDKNIVDQQGEQIGQVEDLLIDLQTGGLAYVIVSIEVDDNNGFDFGTDDANRFAVSPQTLRLPDPDEDVVMNIDRQAFRQPQEFATDQWTRQDRQRDQVYRYGEQDQEEWRGVFGREQRERTDREYRDTDREREDTERTTPGTEL